MLWFGKFVVVFVVVVVAGGSDVGSGRGGVRHRRSGTVLAYFHIHRLFKGGREGVFMFVCLFFFTEGWDFHG